MKKIALHVFLLLFTKSICAQNTNLDFKSALKIYNLSTFSIYESTEKFSSSPANTYYYSSSELRILKPTIAYLWKTKKNNFHEIELNNFVLNHFKSEIEVEDDSTKFKQMIRGQNVLLSYFSGQYEYILNYNKSKEKKLVPSLGFAVNPYFKQEINNPVTALSFRTKNSYMGLKLFLTPRINYYLSSKFFLDVNIPICFTDMNYETIKTENPAIPEKNRKINTINFESFPKIFSGRIGIGFKL